MVCLSSLAYWRVLRLPPSSLLCLTCFSPLLSSFVVPVAFGFPFLLPFSFALLSFWLLVVGRVAAPLGFCVGAPFSSRSFLSACFFVALLLLGLGGFFFGLLARGVFFSFVSVLGRWVFKFFLFFFFVFFCFFFACGVRGSLCPPSLRCAPGRVGFACSWAGRVVCCRWRVFNMLFAGVTRFADVSFPWLSAY